MNWTVSSNEQVSLLSNTTDHERPHDPSAKQQPPCKTVNWPIKRQINSILHLDSLTPLLSPCPSFDSKREQCLEFISSFCNNIFHLTTKEVQFLLFCLFLFHLACQSCSVGNEGWLFHIESQKWLSDNVRMWMLAPTALSFDWNQWDKKLSQMLKEKPFKNVCCTWQQLLRCTLIFVIVMWTKWFNVWAWQWNVGFERDGVNILASVLHLSLLDLSSALKIMPNWRWLPPASLFAEFQNLLLQLKQVHIGCWAQKRHWHVTNRKLVLFQACTVWALRGQSVLDFWTKQAIPVLVTCCMTDWQTVHVEFHFVGLVRDPCCSQTNTWHQLKKFPMKISKVWLANACCCQHGHVDGQEQLVAGHVQKKNWFSPRVTLKANQQGPTLQCWPKCP